MSNPHIHSIPYRADTSELFHYLASEPWAIFLDSCHPYTQQGRYDILSARPRVTLSTCGNTTTIASAEHTSTSTTDPFALIEDYLPQTLDNPMDLPFIGGALGYFSYDLGRRLETLATLANNDILLPDMAVGMYDNCVIMDHHRRCGYLITAAHSNADELFWQQFKQFCHQPSSSIAHNKFKLLSPFQANFTRTQYQQAFEKIQDYIQAGDCYQVNLTQRFQATVQGDPWQTYCQLRRQNPAPFAAFLNYPHVAILCCSPERFIHAQQQNIQTKPIKGTKARSFNPELDKALSTALLHSEKDRAENLMIVDLLRNDLGKSCRSGSIIVPQFCQIESFKQVHHLVSTIQGQLRDDKTALDVLRDCFPGGSITGAPKLRAMQIIEELEPQRRGIYCGSIGYYSTDHQMDTNIAIRTALWSNDQLYCSAGGGIVAESQCDAEFAESLIKIAPLLQCFEALSNGN